MGLLFNPRNPIKLVTLVVLATLMLALYTYSSQTAHYFGLQELPLFSGPPIRDSCTPQAWNRGSWKHSAPRTNLTAMTNQADALQFAGFQGCGADPEFFWYLASSEESQWDRWPAVASYKWAPSKECDGMGPLDGAEMLRNMVEDGGWLFIGDSITQGHFFSLSCLLSPHIRMTPDYSENRHWDRAWPKSLFLNPASPLISSFDLPANFSIENTPLATFRRNDLLFSQEELVDLHREIYNPQEGFALFGEEAHWSFGLKEYMGLFTTPAPHGNYGTLIVSSAGHWTTQTLGGFRNDEAGQQDLGFGVKGILGFFEHAMERWAAEVQTLLSEDQRVNPRMKPRRVVVRPYTTTHDDCHDYRKPWKVYIPSVWKSDHSFWIKDFNRIFEKILRSPSYPSIFYLPIETPALLRPDAHVGSDCEHIMAGSGVMEAWSHYIWHFVSKELDGRI